MRRLLDPHLLARIALMVLLLFSLKQIREMREPSKTAWAKHLAEGKDPTVAEHVEVGMWYGAAARAAIAAALLLISLGWRKDAAQGHRSERHLRLNGVRVPGLVFWSGVGVIVAGAAVMRLPRMTQSFWVDEADAVATYVHGQFRPMKKKDPQGLFVSRTSRGGTPFSARDMGRTTTCSSASPAACA